MAVYIVGRTVSVTVVMGENIGSIRPPPPDFGFESLFVYDEEEGRYFPTPEFDEEGPMLTFMDEYNDETFWKELVERLAMRDVLSHIGQKEFHDMEVEERLSKLDAAIDVYENEFAKNGLNRLAIDF